MNESPSQRAAMAADRLHARLAQGWNTWDTRSVLRHVRLPDGLALSLGFAAYDKLVWQGDAQFGRRTMGRTPGTMLTSTDRTLPLGNLIEVRPGIRSYDGAYTSLELNLRGARFTVETAALGDDWVARITPMQDEPWPRVFTVQAGFLWNRPGHARRDGEARLTVVAPGGDVGLWIEGEAFEDPNLPAQTPYLAARLDRVVTVCAGTHRTAAEVAAIVEAARAEVQALHDAYGESSDGHAAMQTSLAWNVVYEPKFRRLVLTVARDWNCIRGGYAVFCWDTFFTAWMVARDRPELGRACLLEAFREMIDDRFVSNVVQGTGRQARDRSQPPVASICVLGMHRDHPDLATLEAAWPALLTWNRWWHEARRNANGSLSLGSQPFTPRVGDPAEFVQPNTLAGAALEALDNSPIYDDAPFDPATHLMGLEDVGLNALYTADCEALAAIATELGHAAEASELKARAATYGTALQTLWNDGDGIYRNRHVADGAWIDHHAPPSFYPLLAGTATPEQARRLVEEHLLNPAEYAGEWMIPAAPRNDPTFAEQLYMRGRIWPPLNFLVYLGLRRYGFEDVRRQLVDKSRELLVRNWREHAVVAENFSAIDGTGGVGEHTHPLLTWGGLLAFMGLIESGRVAAPLPPVAAIVAKTEVQG